MGAAYLLPRMIGLAKATELLYTGDFISAQEAERIGLYNRVVPADQLVDVTSEMAERLARGPSFALAKTKEMLNRELHMNSKRPWKVKRRPRRFACSTLTTAKPMMRSSRSVNRSSRVRQCSEFNLQVVHSQRAS